MDATRRELQANFERSGLSAEAGAARLGVGAVVSVLIAAGSAAYPYIQPMIQQYLPH